MVPFGSFWCVLGSRISFSVQIRRLGPVSILPLGLLGWDDWITRPSTIVELSDEVFPVVFSASGSVVRSGILVRL
jgi:hypothetical protein